jgi:MFS family permease
VHRDAFVFAAACAGMLLFGIVFLSLGSVNNMLAERFLLDDNAIGTLTALLPFGILAGSLVFGPVVDRFGYRWMLVAAALVVGAGLEGLAFADRKGLVQAFVFLIGAGGGVLNGATNALAADVSPGARGSRLSLLGVFFGLGAMTMPGTLALLSRHFPLSAIVAAIGLITLAPVAWFLLIRFPPPKQRGEPYSIRRSVSLLRDPVFLLAGLALAVQSGMEGMSNDWMTRYVKHVTLAGQSAEEWRTQLGLLAVTGAMVGTRLALSRLLTRVRSQAVLFASIGVTAVGALTLMGSPGYAASLGAALCLGAGLAAAFPVVLGYVGDLYPARSGAAFSTLFVVALIGNMTINKTFGALAQVHGVGQYARVMLACLAVSAVLLGLVVRRLPGSDPAWKDGTP